MRKKYSLGKKKREREIRPQPGPSDVLHHCSGTKLFLGLKKAKGNWRHAWVPSSPHHEVFQAPQCYTDRQTLPATRSIRFTFNNKAKHATVIFKPPIAVVVWVQKGHRHARCLSGSHFGWQGRKAAFTHPAMGFPGDLEQVRLVSLEKGELQILLQFSLSWFDLCSRV